VRPSAATFLKNVALRAKSLPAPDLDPLVFICI